MRGRYVHGGAEAQLEDRSAEGKPAAHIKLVVAHADAARGDATAVMRDVCADADRHGVELSLMAEPLPGLASEPGGGLGYARLKRWYQGFGFRSFLMANAMFRRPQAEARRFDPAEHPRGTGGRFIELFHGTSSEAAESAFHHGMTADRYSPYNRVLTARKGEAGYFATMGRRAKHGGAVTTIRIPEDQAAEYLDGPDSQGLASLKKPLPASMVTKVEHITGPMAGQVTRGRGLGWSDAGDELLRAAAWDPAKHPRVEHGKGGGRFARKPGVGAEVPGIRQYKAAYDPHLMDVAESAGDDDVQAEIGRAISALRRGNGREGSDLLAHAAVLAGAKATNADKTAADREKLRAAADELQAAANAAAAEWGGQKHLSAELGQYAEEAKGDSVPRRLKVARNLYDSGDWQGASRHISLAAWDAYDGGDTDMARRLAEAVAQVQTTHDDVDWVGDQRGVSDQIRLEQRLAGLAGDREAENWLRRAAQAWDSGDPDKTVQHLRVAGSMIQDPAPSASARLLVLADRIDAKRGENAKLTEAVRGFVATGAKAVPDLLGGGKQTWDGTLDVPAELPARGLSTTLAQVGWDGKMSMIAPVAKGIRDDLAGTGPIDSMDSFTVPLHELIHTTVGGKWHAQQEAHAKSGRTVDDDAVLGKMASLDAGGFTGPYSAEAVNGSDWVNQVQADATLKATTAAMESLERRGYLEAAGSGVSYDAQGLPRDAPGGGIARVPVYRRTAKVAATDPPDGPEPGPGEGQAEYQDPQVQPIEEGFTELGTIQHAAGWYRKVGVGDRETPVLAVATEPDPVAKAKLARELEGHAGERPGEAHQWMEAARKVRRDDPRGAHRELAKILDSRGGTDPEVIQLSAKLGATFSPHVEDNPAYVKRRQELLDDVFKAQLALSDRLRHPGEAAPDRVVAESVLKDAQAALSRVHGNLDVHAPPEDTLAELARLQHSGDKELADAAARIKAELAALTDTPESRHATMAEYAERVAADRERIVNGDAWGHYGPETAQAYLWCEAVAEAEGLKPGTPEFRRRVTELADEVNRESAAHKTDVMAAQVARLPGMDAGRSLATAASIRLNWEHGALIALQEAQKRGRERASVSRAAWDPAEHPRVPHGRGGGEFASKPAISLRAQPSTEAEFLAEALHSWKGDPHTMQNHMRAAEAGEPPPGSGSGKQMRREAEALLAALRASPPNPVRLYRGATADPAGRGVLGWSESRAVARRRIGKAGRVYVMPAGTAPALRVADHIGAYSEEQEWLAAMPGA